MSETFLAILTKTCLLNSLPHGLSGGFLCTKESSFLQMRIRISDRWMCGFQAKSRHKGKKISAGRCRQIFPAAFNFCGPRSYEDWDANLRMML